MHRFGLVMVLVALSMFFTGIIGRSIPDLHRFKRQAADLEAADLEARLALQRHTPSGCKDIGCGFINMSDREKRAASDQRIAELQALIALSKGAQGTLGHGQVDPFDAGKRKRSEDSVLYRDSNLNKLRFILRILEELEEESS